MVFPVVVWAVGLAAIVAVPVQAAAAGDLIKVATSSAVYYLGDGNKRYIFPNQATYKTWYSDFSGVKTISQSEIEDMTIGGNVTFRPGTRLVKFPTVPKTYAVEPGGVLRHIVSEAVAESLYGSQWYLWIDEVPEENFIAYTEGADITDSTYPTGTLVMESGGSTVYYIDGSEKRPIADEAAFNANRFVWDNVVTATSLAAYTAGSSITGEESDISMIDGTEATAPVTSTGTLTVSLASDTPASATVVQNATQVKFTKINLTATGGDVIIDNIQIKRMGLSQDSNFSNVYILDADGNMHGNEKTLSSTHTTYVTEDLTVANGASKILYLAATMNSTLQAGETAALAVSEVNLKGNATLSASLPITGNEMTMNSTIAIGTVTPADGGLATTATKPVGTTDYTFASVRLTVNSTEDVQVEKIRFYQSGTAADSDVANLDLVLEGNVLGTVAEPDDKYVEFDLSSSPYTITKGQNKTFELRGDIMDGSSRTIDFEVYNKADILVKGKTYGFYIAPSYTNTSAPYWTNSYPTTVSTGTLTVSKATLDSSNVAEGATQQEIGAFYFHAQGEGVIVTQMIMNVVTSTSPVTGEITNLTMYDEDGDVVAGPQDKVDAATDTVTFTDTFTVPTGIHKYIIKGDLDSNFAADATVYMQFGTPNSKITAKGEITNNSISPNPASNINGDTVTIKIADLNISTSSSPAAQSVAAGTSGYVFANFVLDATQSGEDIKVTQLAIKHTSSAYNIHSYITGISLYDGSTLLNTPQAGESSTTVSTATSTITFTNPLIITKGTAKTITLKADISGSAADGSTHQFGLVGTACATSYGNSTGNSVTEDVTNSDGQTMTITTGGTVRMTNAGANPSTGLILADSTNTMGIFTFEALYESIEIQKVGLTIASGNDYKDIDWLQLYDGATKVGEIQVTSAQATITPADLVIPQNGAKTLTLKAVTHKVGQLESGTSGDGIVIGVTGLEAKGKSTGSTSVTKTGLDTTTTNTLYIFKTKPTVTKVSLSGMANGEQDLYKFTVAADSKGDVGFYKASFNISTTSATVTNFKIYEIDGSSETDLSSNVLTTTEVQTSGSGGTGGTVVLNALFDTDSTGIAAGGEMRTIGAGSSKTYALRGNVTNWGTNSSIQVQMLGENSTVTMQVASTVDNDADDNFIWSDLFLGYTSTTATAAVEWTNGYKILATSSQNF